MCRSRSCAWGAASRRQDRFFAAQRWAARRSLRAGAHPPGRLTRVGPGRVGAPRGRLEAWRGGSPRDARAGVFHVERWALAPGWSWTASGVDTRHRAPGLTGSWVVVDRFRGSMSGTGFPGSGLPRLMGTSFPRSAGPRAAGREAWPDRRPPPQRRTPETRPPRRAQEEPRARPRPSKARGRAPRAPRAAFRGRATRSTRPPAEAREEPGRREDQRPEGRPGRKARHCDPPSRRARGPSYEPTGRTGAQCPAPDLRSRPATNRKH